MAIPKFDADLNIISKLADKPNDAEGLSSQALKEEFDRAGLLVKEYINEILVPQANIDIDNAAKGIGGSEGMDGSAIVDGTVTASKLAANSVTAEKIAEDAVTADKIAPKAVTEEAFADASVPTRAYKQGSVTAAALAQNSVTADKIAESSVGTSKILNGSVTRAKLASDALHSPVIRLYSGVPNRDLTADDDGKTIMTMTNSVDFTVNLSADASANMPEGFEIAVCFYYGQSLQISIESGIYVAHSEFGKTRSGIIFSIPEQNTMIALKKVLTYNGYSYWLVTGNVEVVE